MSQVKSSAHLLSGRLVFADERAVVASQWADAPAHVCVCTCVYADRSCSVIGEERRVNDGKRPNVACGGVTNASPSPSPNRRVRTVR